MATTASGVITPSRTLPSSGELRLICQFWQWPQRMEHPTLPSESTRVPGR